ncbi:wax ester synthase-like Acyl-CoA acyltransferase domain protein [Mycobacterium xenopi 3993]|nr:wax ester synthase-like Acyl-CoA acyltransferase domain protein [Mycobacterium xenopi 3993]
MRRSARKLSPDLTRPFTPPPTFINHMLTPERRFATATLALSDVKETGKHLGSRSTTWCWRCRPAHCGPCCSAMTVRPTIRYWRRCR